MAHRSHLAERYPGQSILIHSRPRADNEIIWFICLLTKLIFQKHSVRCMKQHVAVARAKL